MSCEDKNESSVNFWRRVAQLMRDTHEHIDNLDRCSKGALTKPKRHGFLCVLYMGDLFHQREQWAGQLLQHNFK